MQLVRRERARERFVSQLISVAASTSVRMLSNVVWGIASLFVVMFFQVFCVEGAAADALSVARADAQTSAKEQQSTSAGRRRKEVALPSCQLFF